VFRIWSTIAIGCAFAILISASPSSATLPGADPFVKVAIDSKSSIDIDRAVNMYNTTALGLARVLYECFIFKNVDRRAATEIVFHFRYYNANGDHNGDDVLTRRGRFSTGVDIVPRVRIIDPPGQCVQLHYPPDGISIFTFWIQSVNYDDGTTWTANDLQLPEHLPDWHPAATAAPAPRPSTDTSQQ
jgi:hypothetical protein